MKRIYVVFQFFFVAVAVCLFSGCQDTCVQTLTYAVYEPVYMTKSEFYAAARVEAPRALGRAGKIYIKDNYLFISETGKGIHIINNRNPASPQPVSFVNIPGNVDIAMKGSILYADSKMDFLAIDISNPQAARIVKRIPDVFPYTQFYPGPLVQSANIPRLDTNRVIVDWVKREEKQVSECANMQTGWINWRGGWGFATIDAMSANANSGAPFSGGTGTGGSMARFSVVNNILYTIDNSTLRLFDVTQAANPDKKKEMTIGGGVETIFPYNNHLFFGTTTGMLIYSIANPENPSYVSQVTHFLGCDPVAVEGNYAYVTIKGGSDCRSAWDSQLEVVDISNIAAPRTIKTYSMEDPNGLGIDGTTLFICDGKAGLKIYDATDKFTIDKQQIGHYQIHAYDIIPHNKTAIVVGNDGLYQFDYTMPRSIRLLSVIPIPES